MDETTPTNPAPEPQPQGETGVFEATQKQEIDPQSFLLPKKPLAPAVELPQPAETPQEATTEAAPQPSAQSTIQTPEEGSLRAIRTYKEDIQDTIRETNASLTSIASAESERRASMPIDLQPAQPEERGSKKLLLIGLGVLCIVGGIGALSLLFFLQKEAPGIEEISTPVAFIAVDESVEIDVTDMEKASLMSALLFYRDQTNLSVGLIRGIFPTVRTGTTTRELMSGSSFLTLLSPAMPPILMRTIKPDFMLGVHVFDGNQPFLIMKVASYDQAFAGMLEWEAILARDLAPAFTRRPRPRAQTETTTPIATSPFLQTHFEDRTIQNRDTRVLRNEEGNIVLLYTFLDRDTLLITTNENTMQEIVTRLKNAPLLVP